MNERDPIAAEDVSLAVAGPNWLHAKEPGTWRVTATDSKQRPVAGFAVFAQLGHGSGRPYRGMTDIDGEVKFEFTLSESAPSISIQFAAAPPRYSIDERFPAGDRKQVVTCTIVAPDEPATMPAR